MEVTLLKIPGEVTTVVSALHRWIWGIERCLEQLITPRGFRSVSSIDEARKMALPCVKVWESNQVNF